MAALSLFLGTPQITAKHYPQHYMDDAINFYATISVLDDDLFSGVLLERASVYFGQANMRRKMAFHYVLAGHRMSKAGQKQLSMECYKRALPEYLSKHWVFAEVNFYMRE
ncbi:unnamed protein product [Gongylonema pulchrum]|uniref:TPR_REGION domain-containing protein n=1 Tax=Gongylonema pulchrum TaxID=637853 RepID=A0A183ERN5_9BILA|nr:unnamed protein product [Gongylonema pulchrum]